MSNSFDSVAGVLAAVGRDLGSTDWMVLDQERIDLFADATDDHQWIHVDPERARAGPVRRLRRARLPHAGLANKFLPQLVQYEHLKMGVNYGCEQGALSRRRCAPARASAAMARWWPPSP
jgi:acyl dehydratase